MYDWPIPVTKDAHPAQLDRCHIVSWLELDKLHRIREAALEGVDVRANGCTAAPDVAEGVWLCRPAIQDPDVEQRLSQTKVPKLASKSTPPIRSPAYYSNPCFRKRK
jgi:hypothetical protein